MNFIHDFDEFYKDGKDAEQVFNLHIYLGVLIGVVFFNIHLCFLWNTDRNDNLHLADSTQSGLSSNSKTPIENAISELNLRHDLAQMDLPKAFRCRISNNLILNPVFNVNGDTYDREPYIRYLTEHGNIDPITQESLQNTILRPNIVLRAQILDFLTRQAKVLGENNPNNTNNSSMLTQFKGFIIKSIPFLASAPVGETSAFSSDTRRPLLS